MRYAGTAICWQECDGWLFSLDVNGQIIKTKCVLKKDGTDTGCSELKVIR